MFLKQSTAHTFRFGPFLDDGDAKTEENALTIAASAILLSKAGGAYAPKNEGTALTSTGANGHYTCILNATDTNTLGTLRAYALITGALPVWRDFMILPANVYDSLVGNTDQLQVDLTQINGSTTVAGKLEKAASTMLLGTVASGSSTTVVNTSDVTEATSDHYKDATLIFITGALAGQRKPISAYNGTTKAFTMNAALTEAPTAGDTFIVV